MLTYNFGLPLTLTCAAEMSLTESTAGMNPEQLLIKFHNNVIQKLDDLWNNKNFKVTDDVFTKDILSRNPLGDTVGVLDFKNRMVLPLFNGFPDLKFISHEVISQGSNLVNR